MLHQLFTRCGPAFLSRSVRGRTPAGSSRRLAVESLESRQFLSGTPEFQVLNDATTNLAYRYSETGTPQGSFTLTAANAAPRGAASAVTLERTWVLDANRNVYVYDSVSGGLLGSWGAGTLASNAQPEGIATNGTDIWIVDNRSDKVFYYAGAANLPLNPQAPPATIAATSSFSLVSSPPSTVNTNPKDIVSDGASLWVVDDGSKADKVFKYSVAGNYVGNWTIDSANKSPTGIALDPANIGNMWIADSGTDRVYQYAGVTARNSGTQAAASSFPLASGNSNPQGLVVPGRPWVEVPYQVEWVRQLGDEQNQFGRGVTTDSSGNVYVSGENSDATPFGLARYDSVGTLAWFLQDGYRGGLRIETDYAGNVFSPGQNGMNKYAADGTLLWTTPIPSPQVIFGVAVDELGNAYGATSDYIAYDFIIIRKFDGQTGNIVWERTLSTGNTNTSGISVDRNGGVYVLGNTDGSVLGPSAGSTDVYIVKYNYDGDFQWARQFGSAGVDQAFHVRADGLGNVYAAGTTSGSFPGSTLVGDRDFFLTKYNAAGNQQWVRQFGTSGVDGGSNFWTDSFGNIFMSGTSRGSLGGSLLGERDIVVSKFDPAGNLLWRTQIGTAFDDASGGALTVDTNGVVYIAGLTTGSWGSVNAGGQDVVLVKLSPSSSAATASGSENTLRGSTPANDADASLRSFLPNASNVPAMTRIELADRVESVKSLDGLGFTAQASRRIQALLPVHAWGDLDEALTRHCTRRPVDEQLADALSDWWASKAFDSF